MWAAAKYFWFLYAIEKNLMVKRNPEWNVLFHAVYIRINDSRK